MDDTGLISRTHGLSSGLRRSASQRVPVDHDRQLKSYSGLPHRKFSFNKKTVNRRISAPLQRQKYVSAQVPSVGGSRHRRYEFIMLLINYFYCSSYRS